MPDYIHKPIFVTGLPRSGTSMVAGLLNLCGAWVGTTFPGDSRNPRGYFEHVVIRERIVKQLLSKLGCDPLGVSRLPALDVSSKVDNLEQVIRNILQRDGYDQNAPWLYKDAKLTLLWPVFAQAFPGATWVIVKRNPEQVIDSCTRTPFMAQHASSRDFWVAFVDQYENRLATLADTVHSAVLVDSGELVGGDYSAFSNILPQLGLQFRQKAVEEFICDDFWHG